jgi:HD-like signal output (HDOD) protein
LTEDRLKKVISQVDSLPSLPSLYAELVDALGSPDTSVRQIGEIISKDVGMAAKVLQLVNSAFFGLCQHVSSPAQAATLLGLETIKALVLSVQIFSAFKESDLPGFPLERLWKHSMMTGLVAKGIAQKEEADRATIDDTFMAGLLHDSGKLVLASKFPQQYAQALGLVRRESIPLCKAEIEVFEATHSEVGAYLMGLWGLPDSILEPLAFHHTPDRSCGNEFGSLTAVHVGDALEHEERRVGSDGTIAAIDPDYLQNINVADRLGLWREVSQKAGKTGAKDDG